MSGFGFGILYLNDSMLLLRKPEPGKPAHGKNWNVKKVYPCPDKMDETCVDMGAPEPYRIFCWDCAAYRNSTVQSVNDSLEFEIFDGGHRSLFWNGAYLLKGAVMVRDYDFRREQLRTLVSLK